MEVLLILLLLTIVSTEIILDPINDEVRTIESITIHFWNGEEFLSEPFNITGQIVLEGDDVDIKIVLYPCAGGVDTIADSFKERGAIAVIFGSCITAPYGRAGYRLDTPRTELSMPAIQVNVDEFVVIQKAVEEGEVYAIITSEHPLLNPNVADFVIGGTVSMIFGLLYFSSMLIITVALLVFELRDYAKSGIKTYILIILIITFIMGIIFSVIDPLGSRRTVSWTFPIFYQLFNIPLMIIVELLVSVFWFDSVQQSLFSKFLVKTKIPLLVVCGIYVVILSITVILSMIDPLLLQAMFSFLLYFYLFSIFILSTFHLIVGIYLFGRIKKIQSKAKLKKTSFVFIYKIFGIVTFDIFQVAILILFGVTVLSSVGYTIGAMTLVIAPGFRAALILSLFTWKISTTSSRGGSTGASKQSRTSKKKENRTDSSY